ncbi:MAG: MFS transporter [Pseudomonadota bacterium]
MSDHGSARPRLTTQIALLALTPFSLGYFLSYLYRAVNAVVAPDLVRDIGLDAAGLGLLTAAYLLAFALFQLPLGLLLDRYGPRRVQAALVACAALGSVLFAVGQDVYTLTIARAIIGMGFAGGLMSGFKAVVLWVPEERRALANACVMSLGALGLLVATVPMEFAVQAVGWRMVFWWLAAITAIVAAVIFLVVPRTHDGPIGAEESFGQSVASLVSILKSRTFWVLAPLLGSSAGAHIAIQTLWAGPWFRDVAGMDRDGVALYLFLTASAFFIGILLTGVVTDWLGRRGVSILNVMLGFAVVFLISQIGIISHWPPAMWLSWVVFGMLGQVAILAYPWLSSHYGAALSGRANTAMNLFIFSSAFAIQYLIGEIIDLYPNSPSGGYDPQGFQAGFGLFLVLQFLALGWYLIGMSRLRRDGIVKD